MQFIKKTSLRASLTGILIKFVLVLVIILSAVFLLNKIDFPAQKKEKKKLISNENLKVVK